mgnify:CR=1 FL=1
MNAEIGPQNDYSYSNLLNDESLSISTSVISPFWVGGAYTHITSADYSMNLVGVAFGSPGIGVTTVPSKMGTSTVFIVGSSLETLQDSVNRARIILYYHPNRTYHRDCVNQNSNTINLKPLH